MKVAVIVLIGFVAFAGCGTSKGVDTNNSNNTVVPKKPADACKKKQKEFLESKSWEVGNLSHLIDIVTALSGEEVENVLQCK